MPTASVNRVMKGRRTKTLEGRPSVGIRELKTRASAIVEDVKSRRVTYAVTKRGTVEALIVPVDAGEHLRTSSDSAWEAWQALIDQLSQEAGGEPPSALQELGQMRR